MRTGMGMGMGISTSMRFGMGPWSSLGAARDLAHCSIRAICFITVSWRTAEHFFFNGRPFHIADQTLRARFTGALRGTCGHSAHKPRSTSSAYTTRLSQSFDLPLSCSFSFNTSGSFGTHQVFTSAVTVHAHCNCLPSLSSSSTKHLTSPVKGA